MDGVPPIDNTNHFQIRRNKAESEFAWNSHHPWHESPLRRWVLCQGCTSFVLLLRARKAKLLLHVYQILWHFSSRRKLALRCFGGHYIPQRRMSNYQMEGSKDGNQACKKTCSLKVRKLHACSLATRAHNQSEGRRV